MQTEYSLTPSIPVNIYPSTTARRLPLCICIILQILFVVNNVKIIAYCASASLAPSENRTYSEVVQHCASNLAFVWFLGLLLLGFFFSGVLLGFFFPTIFHPV